MPKLLNYKAKFNLRLYLVTDSYLTAGRSVFFIVEQALKGGVTIVQYRNKKASTKDLLFEAKRLKTITQKYNVPLIINDRIDIANLINAEGVHLGQNDLSLLESRKILGKRKIIGVSVHSVAEAQVAEKEGANYLGIGPVFATITKTDAREPLGLKKLEEIVKSVSVPCVAIGGIKSENIAQVANTGVAGVAVVSIITLAKNIETTVRKLKKKLNKKDFKYL